jgi:GxxExxY protein
MRVHTRLGPGLLESTYRRCLVRELRKAGIRCDTERRVSVRYEDETLPNSYRADIVAEDELVIETKSVAKLTRIDHAQLVTHMKHLNLRSGLLFNFNVIRLKDGIVSVTR